MALDDWITSEQFEPRRPPGAEVQPGTILYVSGAGDYVALSSRDFLLDRADWVEAGTPRDIELELEGSSSMQGVAAASAGKTASPRVEVKSAGDGIATIHLRGVRKATLPLNRISDLTRVNQRVTEAIQRSPDTLFVVTDALIAESLELTFRESNSSDLQSRLDAVRNRLGVAVTGSTQGKITSQGPLVLGVRLAQLSLASQVLGGGGEAMQARPFSTNDLEKFRSHAAPFLSPLWSGYDVHALVIGLGNYPATSPRVGGELRGAIDSAELVAANLRRMLPIDQRNNVGLITSALGTASGFDRTQRLRKADLIQRVQQWVEQTKTRLDPNRRALIILYYFGHGLADGMSRSVLLVPEGFVDDSRQRVDQLADRLVPVDWVIRELGQLSDRLVLLVDACREHQQQDQTLVDQFPGSDAQKGNLRDILNAIQFSAGTYGPHPLLFGSADGTNASVVSYPRASQERIGPLARRLDEVFAEVSARGEALTVGAFVDAMSAAATDEGVRAFTSLRADFREQLNDVIFLDARPRTVDLREQAFFSPYQEVMSVAGVEPTWRIRPPAVGRSLLCELDDWEIRGLTLDASRSRAYVADDAWRVYACPLGAGAPYRVDYPTGQGWLPVIGMSAEGQLIGYSPDERRHFRLEKDEFVPLDSGAFTRVIGESFSGHPVAVGFLVNNSSQRIILRQLGDRWVPTRYPPPPGDEELLDLVESAPHILYYTTPNGLWRTDDRVGARTQLPKTIWQPTALATGPSGNVFSLSANGRALYRIDTSGKIEWADLLPAGLSDEFVAKMHVTGFAAADDRQLLIGIGRWVVRVVPSEAAWLPIPTSSV